MALICMPGGFGTLDELTEALTLIQTGKSRKMPIILVGKDFWGGLHDWMRDQLLKEKLISPGDIELMQIIEEPQSIATSAKVSRRRGGSGKRFWVFDERCWRVFERVTKSIELEVGSTDSNGRWNRFTTVSIYKDY
jgi:predicted Rossmann-fold nucleotide-binding protein